MKTLGLVMLTRPEILPSIFKQVHFLKENSIIVFIILIFSSDLRQDMLALQFMRLARSLEFIGLSSAFL